MRRRFCLIMLTVLLLAMLVGCGPKEPEARTAVFNVDNQEMVVTFEPGNLSAGTIEAPNGTYTFAYTYSRTGNQVEFELVYPDGYVYRHTETSVGGGGSTVTTSAISTAIDYSAAEREEKGYVDGFSMNWALDGVARDDRRENRKDGPSPFVGILFIALGIWNVAAPQTAWYLAHGWKFKDAEPSDMAIGAYRFTGGLAVFIGIIILIASF